MGRRTMVVLVLLAASGLLSGCVTSKKYRLASKKTPPAQPLNWSAEHVEGGGVAPKAILSTLIIYKGPGTWKREAKWDEYVIQVENSTADAFTLESAELLDLRSEIQLPGTDPWELEKQSYTNWEKYGRSGVNVLAGAGWVALYGLAQFAASPILTFGPAAASAGATTAMTVIPVVAVANVVYVIGANRANKRKVVAEFKRRRLELPIALGPHETKAGSLFFPMTPGPRQLLLKGNSAGRPLALAISLTPLGQLHLKPK
jgi:hypothetical protein